MNGEDQAAFRAVRNWMLGIVLGIVLIGGGAAIVSRAFSLFWFPWEIQMRTNMIRASNSYITTQQTSLRQFYIAALSSQNEAQRRAIMAQMRQVADLIPNEVPPDIAAYLSQNGVN